MKQILEKIEEQLGTGISASLFNKDIQQMKRIFQAPIRYDRRHQGYCYTEPDFSLLEFPLTHEEIEALDYSTALLHQLKGTRMFARFENAINKVIEGYRIHRILGIPENQILQVEEPLRPGGTQWLEPVLKAIVEKQALQVHYRGFYREESVHPLSPYLVKEYRNRWYIAGYSARSGNVITLALDRVLHIQPSDEAYERNNGFNPGDFFRYSLGITQIHDAVPQKVILSFSAAAAPYILSQPLHHSQELISDNDRHLIIRLQVYLTAELKMTILSYGREVEVLEPEILRREIAEEISGMAGIYGKTRSTDNS